MEVVTNMAECITNESPTVHTTCLWYMRPCADPPFLRLCEIVVDNPRRVWHVGGNKGGRDMLNKTLKTMVAVGAIWISYAAYLAVNYIGMNVDKRVYFEVSIPLLMSLLAICVFVWWVALSLMTKIDSITSLHR